MSDAVVPFITLAEKDAIEGVVAYTTHAIARECATANSDWPTCEDIYLLACFRCPEESFDAALSVFKQETDSTLYHAATSTENDTVHTFASPNKDFIEAFLAHLNGYAPDALTDCEEFAFAYV